jgi:hypothetical protein
MPSAVAGPHAGAAYDEGPRSESPGPVAGCGRMCVSGKAIACAPIANKSTAREASR